MSTESWQAARAVAATQDWLLTTGQARRCQLTPGELASAVRRRELRRLYRGVYLFDPDLAQDPPWRVVYRAALLSEGDNACLFGISGARVWGIEGLPPTDDVVEVGMVGGPSRRRLTSPGGHPFDLDLPPVVMRQVVVAPDELRVVDGLTVRDVGKTVVDAALRLDRPGALSVLDSSLYQRLISPGQLHALVAAAKGRPGIARVRSLADIADGRAESALESRIRLVCVDGGVAPDTLQHEVRDGWGRLVAVGDLGWLERRDRPLLAEADGRVHELPKALYRDRRRGNTLVAEAYDTVRFTWADSLRPGYVLYVVRSALQAA